MHKNPYTNARTPRTGSGPRRGGPSAILLFAILTLALAGLAAARPSAAQSTAGVIVYSSADHNIWRIGADGGDHRALTQDGLSDSPSWVPGASQIAFSSTRDRQVVTVAEGTITLNQIYLMGSDGSNPTRLSDGSSDDKFPEVIPTGQRIVFLRNHNWRLVGGTAVHDTEIGSMRLDGTDYRVHGSVVTDQRTHLDRYPARISGDGTKIVVVRQATGQSSQIQLLDVASGQLNTVVLDLDRTAPDGSIEYLWPRFDPQGHIVVVRRSYAPGPITTSLISVDTSGKNAQTLIGGLQFEALANGFDVNWAGRTVIGARAPEMPGGLRPEEIYLYDLATGTVAAPLDSGHAPSFSPVAGLPPPTPPPATPTAILPTAAPTITPGGPPPTPAPSQPLIQTADPLFYSVWERVDRPVKESRAVRSWIWGPVAHTAQQEPYGAGTRLVQ
ncbi:MAG TPA: hypothetical protein VKY74_01395, partial [Chloroflexia bacterium]|nr:hypothetical protein [Chloroflexia bacterium]